MFGSSFQNYSYDQYGCISVSMVQWSGNGADFICERFREMGRKSNKFDAEVEANKTSSKKKKKNRINPDKE